MFFRYAANFPWRSQAEWYLTQMQRWRQADDGIDVAAVADAVFRPDLYRTAAAALGLEQQLEVVRAGGGVHRVLDRDASRGHVRVERLVE